MGNEGQKPALDSAEYRVLLSAIAAGGTLSLLLPLGIFVGFSWLYSALFALHLLLLLLSIGIGFRVLLQTTAKPLFPALLLGALIAALESLPVTAKDALIHHLAVPQWWMLAGKIHSIPWHEWSFYPMLLQLGFVPLLQLGSEKLCAAYHALYLIGLMSLCGVTLQRRLGGYSGWLGALLVATIPLFFRLATEPLVDLGLAFFCTVAAVAIIRGSEERRLSLITIAGAALGLALATKYNAIPFVASLGAAWILVYGRTLSPALLGKSALVLTLGIAVLFGGWALKNELWAGNPIYPLYRNLFGGLPVAPSAGGLSPIETRLSLYGESPLEILATPLTMLVKGADEDPRAFDGVLSPILLLALVPFLLPGYRSKDWERLCGVTALMFIALALVSTSPRVRYLAPVLPLLSILAVSGGSTLVARFSRQRLAAAVLITAQVALFSSYALQLTARLELRAFLTGKISTEQYLAARLPEQRLVQFINKSLPLNSRVYLAATGNRFFYIKRNTLSGGHNPADQIREWLATGKNPSQELQALGCTYLLLHEGRISRALEPEPLRIAFERWINTETVLIASDRSYTLRGLLVTDKSPQTGD